MHGDRMRLAVLVLDGYGEWLWGRSVSEAVFGDIQLRALKTIGGTANRNRSLSLKPTCNQRDLLAAI